MFGSKGEHVIPQSFGKFGSQTPTLKCVCQSCNEYFGKDLDTPLARDSIEGMQRYKHGIRSRELRPHRRVTLELAEEEKPEGIPKVTFYMDGVSGRVEVQTAVRLRDDETKKELVVTYKDIEKFDIQPWLKKKLTVEQWGDKRKLKQMFEALKKRGMKFDTPFKMTDLKDVMPKTKQVLLTITGLVDNTTKRGVTKILFNFVAHFIGEDVVLASEWDAAREYIRHGRGELPFETKTGVFWDVETEHITLGPAGTNIRIENKDDGVWGYIQFFNMWIYEVRLARNYHILDGRLLGGKFAPGEEPIMLKPTRIRSPLYIAQFDVDARGRPSIKIQGYGGAR